MGKSTIGAVMEEQKVVRRVVAPVSDNSYELQRISTVEDVRDQYGDQVKLLHEAFEESTEKLIAFVAKQTEYMESKLLFDGRTPSFSELQFAQLQYEGVALGLNTLYQTATNEMEEAVEAYNTWFYTKCAEVREKVNPPSLPASKWYSAKEIEYMVYRDYPKERSTLYATMVEKKREHSNMERMTKMWESYSYALRELRELAKLEVLATGQHTDLEYDETD